MKSRTANTDEMRHAKKYPLNLVGIDYTTRLCDYNIKVHQKELGCVLDLMGHNKVQWSALAEKLMNYLRVS